MNSSVLHNQVPAPRRAPRKVGLARVLRWGIPAGLVLGAVGHVSAIAATAIYIPLFLYVAFWQPRIALMVTFAIVPLVQVLPVHLPVHLDAADFSMSMLLPICLIKSAHLKRPIRVGPSLWPTLLYLFFCFLSTLPHFHPGSPAIPAFAQMVVYLVFATMLCASFPGTTDDLIFALQGAVAFIAVFAVLFIGSHNHLPYEDKNLWGEVFGSGFVMALEFWLAANLRGERGAKRWWLLALCLIAAGCLLCVSRGGWMEATIGSAIVLSMRRQFRLVFRAALVVTPLILALWFTLPQAKQKYAFALGANNVDVQSRLVVIAQTWQNFENHPFFGKGIQIRKEINAVNVFTVALAESGVQGLASFLLLQAVVLGLAWKVHRRLDPRDARFSLVTLGGALIVCRLVHGLVDFYWARGALLWAWGAVGMLTVVYYETRPGRRIQWLGGRAAHPDAAGAGVATGRALEPGPISTSPVAGQQEEVNDG